jgi:hypothetical protein
MGSSIDTGFHPCFMRDRNNKEEIRKEAGNEEIKKDNNLSFTPTGATRSNFFSGYAGLPAGSIGIH